MKRIFIRHKTFLLLLGLFCCTSCAKPKESIIVSEVQKKGSIVNIVGEQDNWTLIVNGTPFYIKGVGCGLVKGKQNEDFLKLAKELGANSLRTWGTDQGTKEYIDKAAEYGLMVNAGIWLNWASAEEGFSYIGDNEYKRSKWKEAIDYVKKYNDHPAILMWNVGNEALLFTKSEEEKIALCQFLEKLIQEIHKIDPNHPVIYAATSYMSFKYIRDYVPSLDIIGSNCYGSIRSIHAAWKHLKFDKPYVITEFGPFLPMDRPKDVNGKSIELDDYKKASIYRHLLLQLKSLRKSNIGGFAFHLGDTTQESMTWWNINQGEFKKQSYWEIFKEYNGILAPYSAPKLKSIDLSKVDNIERGETITVEVILDTALNGNNYNYQYLLSTSVENELKYYVNEYVEIEVIGHGPKVQVKLPQEKGIYRLYCFVKDDKNNLSSINKSLKIE